MWKKSLILFGSVAIICLLAAFFVGGCDQTEKPMQPASSTNGDVSSSYQGDYSSVRLDQPIRLSELVSLESRLGIPIEEFRVESNGVTIGFSVAGKKVGSITESFKREHQKFLDALQLQIQSDNTTPKIISEIRTAIDISIEGLPITVVTFRADEQTVTKAFPQSVVDPDVMISPGNRSEFVVPADSSVSFKDQIGSKALSSSHESWAPYYGQSVITRDYTLQKFYFNNVNDFGSNRTYEHETQIYNSNYADYGGYWATNMPDGYKDTQFGDNIDNFTVGCSRANNLHTYTMYYTYMSLTKQSASSAVCRIRGQIGHRWPSWCTSTWCIYADATTWPGQYALLTVPNGGYCWQY